MYLVAKIEEYHLRMEGQVEVLPPVPENVVKVLKDGEEYDPDEDLALIANGEKESNIPSNDKNL